MVDKTKIDCICTRHKDENLLVDEPNVAGVFFKYEIR